ncbi:MAG: hypothetical protein LUG55_07330 [Clostridiales bacterium]|nr:hypothetical protein [Clostridiales bacterium]
MDNVVDKVESVDNKCGEGTDKDCHDSQENSNNPSISQVSNGCDDEINSTSSDSNNDTSTPARPDSSDGVGRSDPREKNGILHKMREAGKKGLQKLKIRLNKIQLSLTPWIAAVMPANPKHQIVTVLQTKQKLQIAQITVIP